MSRGSRSCGARPSRSTMSRGASPCTIRSTATRSGVGSERAYSSASSASNSTRSTSSSDAPETASSSAVTLRALRSSTSDSLPVRFSRTTCDARRTTKRAALSPSALASAASPLANEPSCAVRTAESRAPWRISSSVTLPESAREMVASPRVFADASISATEPTRSSRPRTSAPGGELGDALERAHPAPERRAHPGEHGAPRRLPCGGSPRPGRRAPASAPAGLPATTAGSPACGAGRRRGGWPGRARSRRGPA
jgi:hypothetical protein